MVARNQGSDIGEVFGGGFRPMRETAGRFASQKHDLAAQVLEQAAAQNAAGAVIRVQHDGKLARANPLNVDDPGE